jgi:hypothetical protein
MKTSKLIQLLQESDPSGDLECCVDNEDIVCTSRSPAYYDGCLELLVRNEHGHVMSGAVCRSGAKVNIVHHSICDCIDDDPNFSVDLSDLSGATHDMWVSRVALFRSEAAHWASHEAALHASPKETKGRSAIIDYIKRLIYGL